MKFLFALTFLVGLVIGFVSAIEYGKAIVDPPPWSSTYDEGYRDGLHDVAAALVRGKLQTEPLRGTETVIGCTFIGATDGPMVVFPETEMATNMIGPLDLRSITVSGCKFYCVSDPRRVKAYRLTATNENRVYRNEPGKEGGR